MPPCLSSANAQLETNDKEARSYFQNGNEAQLLGRVAPSDHNHWIGSMTRAKECLAIHFKTWSKVEFLRRWRPSMTNLLQIWLIWGQKWVAKEHVTYGRHLHWEMRVEGTWRHDMTWLVGFHNAHQVYFWQVTYFHYRICNLGTCLELIPGTSIPTCP